MSFLRELGDVFALGFLSQRSPLFHRDFVTQWAAQKIQTMFEENAKVLADNAASEFFNDPEYQNHSYCFVTVIPDLRENGVIKMMVYTESGLSFEGIARAASSGLTSHLKSYRRQYDRP